LGEHSELLLIDARSEVAAAGNAMAGKGTEDETRYENCKRLFMDIGNIHAMRKSMDALASICQSTSVKEDQWLSAVQTTGWLGHCRKVISAATNIAYYMQEKDVSVIVHCSDGWDRTSQLTSLSQLLLDPYYRTYDGFKVLVEKEWLAFGHKFEERFGTHAHPDERSPVFLQFLDCVHQVVHQFPTAFEFNSNYLIALVLWCNSGWFGTFMYNTERQRLYVICPSTSCNHKPSPFQLTVFCLMTCDK
jgi:myotubularin-related protein 1/2